MRVTAVAVILLGLAPSGLHADGFPIEKVIEAVKSEINRARQAQAYEDETLIITSVEISLTAVARYDANGEIYLEVPIIKELAGQAHLGGGAKLANTQIVSLTLKPSGAPIRVSGSENLGLVPAIESGKAALRAARRGPITFDLEEFVFQIECVVTKSAGGGVRFLFLKAGGGYQGTVIQRITVRMTAGP